MSKNVSTENTLAQIQNELNCGLCKLRFSPMLEERFNRDTRDENLRYAITAGLVGVIVYDSFIFADISVIPDMATMSAFVRFCLVSPFCVAVMLILRQWRGPWVRDIGQALIPTSCVAGILYLMVTSDDPLRIYQHYGVGLVLLYLVVVHYVRFRSLIFSCLAIFTLYVASVFMVSEIPAPARLSAIFIMMGVCASVLAIGYALERKNRLFYLLRLRDRLRNQELDTVSKTDPLTGLGNRRRLDERLAEIWSLPPDNSENIAIVMLDIDYFKKFNDHYGHPTGDNCIRDVARIASSRIRTCDLGIRFGGEELLFLLVGCDQREGMAIAEDIRICIENAAIPHEGRSDGARIVTVSLGIASIVPSALPSSVSAMELLASADAALYAAKRAGRNRVGPFGITTVPVAHSAYETDKQY